MRRSQQIQKEQEREIREGIYGENSAIHAKHLNNPYIIVRNLNYAVSEGDLVTMFEQFGTVVGAVLFRDKKTGASKGTAILKYEDPRSAILAVDNFNGVMLCRRQINVDHTTYKGDLQDPRALIPARLNQERGFQMPTVDYGSDSSTETE